MAARNHPFTRDCTGEESGVGDSEGNDVRLFVSAAGDGARPSEAVELRFEGRMRAVLPFLLFDRVDVWEAERTRPPATATSAAAISMRIGVA
jgi:hypothetical protein